jgi:F-type H+-transporting ATPase subunit epsilon
MKLEVVSPEKVIYTGEITSAKFPGTDGQFEILKDHTPFISTLDKGTIFVKQSDGKEEMLTINAGFVEVLNNNIVVMV